MRQFKVTGRPLTETEEFVASLNVVDEVAVHERLEALIKKRVAAAVLGATRPQRAPIEAQIKPPRRRK